MPDWTTFWAPLVVGLLLWIVAEGVRSWWGRVKTRRDRRRLIISLMGRAVAVQARAIDDGAFDQSYIQDSSKPLAKARARYDDLTAQALDLFEPGEEVVAFWTAAEFYGGWFSPLQWLRDTDTPRDPEGGRLLDRGGMGDGWSQARPQFLAAWAQDGRPWNTGNARGPRYADLFTAGDRSRHNVVIPNSDVNSDMLRPFVLYLGGRSPWETPSRREAARLERMFADANAKAERQMEMAAQERARRAQVQ